MVGPAAKRVVAKDLVSRDECSERKACALVVAARSTVRYEGRRDAVMKYSRKDQARQLAEVLDGLGKP